jgi:hypothetical protein
VTDRSLHADAEAWRRGQLEEVRDILERAGISRTHGDDWPDIVPGLLVLVEQRDKAIKRGDIWKRRAFEIEADRDALIEALREDVRGELPVGAGPVWRRLLLNAQSRWIRARAERDRYRLAWQSAVQGRASWRKLYLEAIKDVRGGCIDRRYFDRLVAKYRYEVEWRDTRIAELTGPPPTTTPTGCHQTRHCVNWGFCHRCDPEFTERVRQEFKSTDRSSDAYAAVIAKLEKEGNA